MPSRTRLILRDLDRVLNKVMTKIALDVAGILKETTPIDTGWARANWVASIGTPSNVSGATSGRPSNADVAARRGQQASSELKLLSYKVALGKIHISNNVPYINRLNNGSSTQAPAGFVQRAIAKAVAQDITGLRL